MRDSKRQRLIEQLSAYLDDELTPAQRREVEAFLAGEEEARALLSELRAMSQALRELPRAKASERLLEGVRTRLERDALLGRSQSRAVAPAGYSRGLRWLGAAAI